MGDFTFRPGCIDDLESTPTFAAALLDVGDQIADAARDRAPKDSGDGARSIRAKLDDRGGDVVAQVSWDRDHFYMGFAEVGTVRQPARPFLRPALDSVRI